MTKKDKKLLETVRWKVDDEGLDYTFMWYSTFEEIKDPEFRKLVDNYCTAAAELDHFIKRNTKGSDFPED